MPAKRTPRRWTYRDTRATRARRVREPGESGRVVRRAAPEPVVRITRLQARLLFGAAMLFAVLSGAWWLSRSPYLTVHDVQVAGASRLSPEDVRAAADIDGVSVFSVDLQGAEARVAALPLVRSVHIEKDGWTRATIHVEERAPWGSWRTGETTVAIDVEGYVLDGASAPEGSPTIIAVDATAAPQPGERVDPGAVELAARLVRESDTAFGRLVLGLAYRQDAGLTAVLSGEDIDGAPVWVTFGDARDYDYKVAALYVLFEQARHEDLALRAVDLRFGDRLSFN